MKPRKLTKKLTLDRETLHRLTDPELEKVAGGATKQLACDPSVRTLCASCLCPI